MKTSSIRIDSNVGDQISQFKLEYKKKNISETLAFIFDFISRNNINLEKDLDRNTLDEVFLSTQNILSQLQLSNQKAEGLAAQEKKNTDRLIRILRAQEQEIFKPLLNKSIGEVAKDDLLETSKKLEKSQEITKEDSNRAIAKLEGKLYLLNSEHTKLKKDFEKNEGEKKELLIKYEELYSKFSRSGLSGRYSITMSEKDYLRFKL